MSAAVGARRAKVTIDPEALRPLVAANKLVRVRIAPSAQFPEGTIGRVRRIGDQAADGDEFVFVEVAIDGTKDVLPFSPADLAPPTSAAPKPKAAKPPAPEPAPRPLPTPVVSTAPTAPKPILRVVAETPAKTPIPAHEAPTTAAKKTSRGNARKPSTPVSVTLTSTGEPGVWKVDAKVGTRAVVRSASVPAAQVWDMVQLLDTPALAEAVRSHLDEQRRAATERAEQLRAELAAVQAELAALPGSPTG